MGVDELAQGRQETWIWTVQGEHAALYRIQDKRSKESAQRMLNDLSAQVLHCDRYSAYSYLEDERVQACRAHLLRDFKAVTKEPGRVGEVGATLVGWEKKLHRARQQAQSQELSAVYRASSKDKGSSRDADWPLGGGRQKGSG